jgi:hypothetical protein
MLARQNHETDQAKTPTHHTDSIVVSVEHADHADHAPFKTQFESQYILYYTLQAQALSTEPALHDSQKQACLRTSGDTKL